MRDIQIRNLIRDLAISVAIATSLTLAGVAIRVVFLSSMEHRTAWLTFYPAVMAAAVFGAWRSGVLATILSVLVVALGWEWMSPRPFLNDRADWLGAVAYLLNCAFVVAIAQRMHQATAKAKEEKDRAEEASRAKSMFLANMSHELRTPMNSILGFTDILSDDPSVPAAARDKLRIVQRNGRQLLETINAVLEISRAEAKGDSSLNLVAMDFHELLFDLQSLFHPSASQKQLNLEVRCESDLPKMVMTDSVKVRQVLINLIGNAIKYTPAGAVTVLARREDRERIVVEVEDSGVGIEAGSLDNIFRPFERTMLGSSTASGTGLGLSICAKFAQQLGGEVRVDSEVGRGSRFQFRFPYIAAEGIAQASNVPVQVEAHLPPGACAKVLVVDDIDANRQFLRCLLEPMGYSVLEASDGLDAVGKVASWGPDVVLMDLWLPGLDGAEATRRIRREQGERKLAVIGLSASALPDEKEEFRRAGLDDILSKPVARTSLALVLAKHTPLAVRESGSARELADDSSFFPISTDCDLDPDWLDRLDLLVRRGDLAGVRDLVDELDGDEQNIGEEILRLAVSMDTRKLRKLVGKLRAGGPELEGIP